MWYEWLRETTWGCSMLRELYSGTHVTVKTEDFRKKLASVGFRQDLLHSFDLPVELSIPTAYWTAFCRASDFSIDMGEILEELNAQGISKPLSHVDMGKTLDSFDFPTPVIDLILEFYEPMSSGEIAEELFQQRNRWKNHHRTFSNDNYKWGSLYGHRVSHPDHNWDYHYNRPSMPLARLNMPFDTLKDYWMKHRCWGSLNETILGEVSDCVQMERYRIGFFEVTGISNMDEEGYPAEGYRKINCEKILVLYESSVESCYIRGHFEDAWSAQAFQPQQWNEYISKLGLKKVPQVRYRLQPVRIKFTSGPTIREAIHQNVQNDVKFVISEMAKELISFLQNDCKSWVGGLFNELGEFGEKQWLFLNGNLRAMSVNAFGAEDPLRENDGVTYTYHFPNDDWYWSYPEELTRTMVPEFDSIKTARKNKWQRTKENSKRKRRQKYDKESNFRRKRVHAKIQASRS